jgi:hypothetical protein
MPFSEEPQEVEIPVFEEEAAEDGGEDIIISGIEFSYDSNFYGGSTGIEVDGKEGVPPIFEENLFGNDDDIIFGNDIESVSETEYEEAGIPSDYERERARVPAEARPTAESVPVYAPFAETASPPDDEPDISLDDLGAFNDIGGVNGIDDGYGDIRGGDGGDFGFSVPDVGIYTNRQPLNFTMFGKKTEVSDWQDMLVKICELLILKSPYIVAQFDKYQDLNSVRQTYFSYNEKDVKHMGRKLSNGLWIEVGRTPDDTVMLCKKLLELCGYPRNELEIEFKD